MSKKGSYFYVSTPYYTNLLGYFIPFVSFCIKIYIHISVNVHMYYSNTRDTEYLKLLFAQSGFLVTIEELAKIPDCQLYWHWACYTRYFNNDWGKKTQRMYSGLINFNNRQRCATTQREAIILLIIYIILLVNEFCKKVYFIEHN